MEADFNDLKSDEDLSAPYWVSNDNNIAYREAIPNEPIADDIESFNGSVRTAIPDDHFFENEECQNPEQ